MPFAKFIGRVASGAQKTLGAATNAWDKGKAIGQEIMSVPILGDAIRAGNQILRDVPGVGSIVGAVEDSASMIDAGLNTANRIAGNKVNGESFSNAQIGQFAKTQLANRGVNNQHLNEFIDRTSARGDQGGGGAVYRTNNYAPAAQAMRDRGGGSMPMPKIPRLQF